MEIVDLPSQTHEVTGHPEALLSVYVVTWRGWGHSWATNKQLYLCRLFVFI